MTEVGKLFARQAEWQESLRRLPWPEKIRMAEAMRDGLARLRRAKSTQARSTGNSDHSERGSHDTNSEAEVKSP